MGDPGLTRGFGRGREGKGRGHVGRVLPAHAGDDASGGNGGVGVVGGDEGESGRVGAAEGLDPLPDRRDGAVPSNSRRAFWEKRGVGFKNRRRGRRGRPARRPGWSSTSYCGPVEPAYV